MDTFICALGGFTGGALLAVLGVATVIFVERRLAAWRAGDSVAGAAASPTSTPQQAVAAGEDPHRAPPALDRTTLAALIEAALDVQRKDRDMRLANTGYWGDTWLWVSRAIGYATPILDVPADGDLRAWLASRPAALEAAHEEYRREEEDPDGYGSGTLWELRRAVDEIRTTL